MFRSSSLLKVGSVFLLLGLSACSKSDFGLPAANQEFAATVTYNNKVDIIMMVDNSSSMLQYQNKFANEVPGMLNALNGLGLDYHIAIVTTDMRSGGNGGRFVGTPRFLTNGTSNLVSTLQARVNQGQNGSDLERGLESIKTVLQPSYLAGEGVGFLRDDALLAMIVLTNEDDYSSGTTDDMIAFLNSVKKPFTSTTKSWIMNFIGVVSLSGQCSTTADFKETGLRYMALADYTNGIKSSVCESSLGTAVSNVRARIVEILSEYKLEYKPVVASIVVHINGQLIPQNASNGWVYYPTTNTIRFYGSAQPGANDSVKIDYDPAEGT